ncbi:unnamed protein product, partial [Rotaria sordida]
MRFPECFNKTIDIPSNTERVPLNEENPVSTSCFLFKKSSSRGH